MKMSLRSLITISLFCSFVFMVTVNSQAGGGKDKVEAAKAKGIPVFVDFGKTSCTPCKMMVPVLDSLTKKYKGNMEVVFVHVDEEKEYAGKMGVTMIPTQILLDKNGKEVSRHVGYIPVEDCMKMVGKTAAPAPAKEAAKDKNGAKAQTATQGKTCSPGSVCK